MLAVVGYWMLTSELANPSRTSPARTSRLISSNASQSMGSQVGSPCGAVLQELVSSFTSADRRKSLMTLSGKMLSKSWFLKTSKYPNVVMCFSPLMAPLMSTSSISLNPFANSSNSLYNVANLVVCRSSISLSRLSWSFPQHPRRYGRTSSRNWKRASATTLSITCVHLRTFRFLCWWTAAWILHRRPLWWRSASSDQGFRDLFIYPFESLFLCCKLVGFTQPQSREISVILNFSTPRLGRPVLPNAYTFLRYKLLCFHSEWLYDCRRHYFVSPWAFRSLWPTRLTFFVISVRVPSNVLDWRCSSAIGTCLLPIEGSNAEAAILAQVSTFIQAVLFARVGFPTFCGFVIVVWCYWWLWCVVLSLLLPSQFGIKFEELTWEYDVVGQRDSHLKPFRVKHSRMSCTRTPESGGGSKEEARDQGSFFEVMANLAIANEGTPSMIDEVDDDMVPLEHVSNQIKVEHDEDGIPIGSPNRIDSVAKFTMEDPMRRAEIMC